MPPRTPLLRPRQYFRRHDRPSLAIGAGVVLLGALAFVIAILVFAQQVVAHVNVPGGTAGGSGIGGILLPFFFAMVAGWLLVSAVLHVFVWFGDGRRGFGTTLAITGEAEFVGLVVVPVVTVVLLSTVGGMPTDPEAAMAYMENAAGMETPALTVVGFVGSLWRAFVIAHGLAEAQGLSAEKAFVLSFGVMIVGFLI